MAVALMFSKTLTNLRNCALVRQKEILKEAPELQIHFEFPDKVMVRKDTQVTIMSCWKSSNVILVLQIFKGMLM